MKNKDLKKLAFVGLAGGVLVLNPAVTMAATAASTDNKQTQIDYSEGNNYQLYTEKELLLELNPEGTKLYQSLTPEGKKLALEVASMKCAYTNACKGLNACKTEKNECAGKGGCKGTGKCAVSDKNLAVKMVAKKMAEKRSQVK